MPLVAWSLFRASPKSPWWSRRSIPYLCNPWARCARSLVFLSCIHFAPALPLFRQSSSSSSSSSSIINKRFWAVQPIVKRMPSALDHTNTSTENRRLYMVSKAQPDNGDDLLVEQAHPYEARDPSRWSRETSPFVAVRYFARDEVTDEYIRGVLRNNNIKTMKDLNDRAKYILIIPLLQKYQDVGFLNCIREALKTERKTAEDVLGGFIQYSVNDVSSIYVETFSKAAVAAKCSNTDNQEPLYSLVMGPSGSGKTLFAMKGLAPIVLREAGGDEKQIYTILLDARDVISTKMKVTLESSLTAYVEKFIDYRGIPTDKTLLQLAMLVIIDEAGSYASDYFDKDEKIRALHNFLQINLRYKFAKGLHLAVVGTGLEVPTQAVSSKTDAIKFRMQPWSLENFDAMVDTSKHSNKADAIKECVRTSPIFQYLVSNARCAYFLMDALAAERPDATSTEKNLLFQSFVDRIVSTVAYRYIGSNALARMNYDDSVQLARALFREIAKANKRPKQVFFPGLDDADMYYGRIANSLLDVNVESAAGELCLMDNEANSVSMTPALTIIVTSLLDKNGIISWGWKGMESIAVLGELQIVIQNMSDDGELGGILRSEWAIPGVRATKNFVVPVVGNSLVLLNGDKAPYANVIAPFRLVQSKFSVDREEHCKINLYEEVSKMGLTAANNKYRLNQGVTSVFYCMWKNKQKSVKYSIAMSRRADYNIDRPHLYDPFQTLLCEVKPKYTKIDCRFDNTTNLVTIKTDGKLLPRQIPALLDFDDKPVTAAFVTNCQSYKLQKNIIITRDDVEWDGKLKGAKAREVADLVPNLRQNVEFQFVIL